MFYLCHNTFLCNQMFPFANVIAYAMTKGVPVIYPNFRKHVDYFPYFRNALCQFPADSSISRVWSVVSGRGFLERWFCRCNHKTGCFPHVLMTPDQCYDFEQACNADVNRRMVSAKVSVLDGLYFLSPTEFMRARDVLLKVFAPSPTVSKNVDACIRHARRGTDILIGTHLRFGDYLAFKRDMAYELQEYYAVMRKFDAMFPGRKVTFLLCSDRPQDPGSFSSVRAERSTGHYVEDLYCLSRCDLVIGPPSTFSQWASFYGQVPLYAINYKNELKYNVPVQDPDVNQFVVHVSGFGRHAVARSASLCVRSDGTGG